MRAALAADSRELHAAERRAQITQEPVVDPGDSHFHGTRHAMSALQVGSPDRGREAVASVVRQLHRLLFGVERRDVTHRAEDLLLDAAGILGEAANDGRLDECAGITLVAEYGYTSAADNLPVLGTCQAVVRQHLLAVRTGYQRPQVRPLER